MVFSGGLLSWLDLLLEKFTRYYHHKQNYERRFSEQIIPTELKNNKNLSDNYYQKWNKVLHDTYKRLAMLLLEESEKVIEIVETDITREMNKKLSGSTDSERISVR